MHKIFKPRKHPSITTCNTRLGKAHIYLQ